MKNKCMCNLIKIVILGIVCGTHLFTNTARGASHVKSITSHETEKGQLVLKSIAHENIHKRKALDSVHAIIRSRYDYNKDLWDFFKNKEKTVEEKINYLTEESSFVYPKNAPLKETFIQLLTPGIKRDLQIYADASKVVFSTNPHGLRIIKFT